MFRFHARINMSSQFLTKKWNKHNRSGNNQWFLEFPSNLTKNPHLKDKIESFLNRFEKLFQISILPLWQRGVIYVEFRNLSEKRITGRSRRYQILSNLANVAWIYSVLARKAFSLFLLWPGTNFIKIVVVTKLWNSLTLLRNYNVVKCFTTKARNFTTL